MTRAPVPGVYHDQQLPDLLTDALIVLRERRDWLTARIEAKRSVGWEIEWDRRERDSLTIVLDAWERAA